MATNILIRDETPSGTCLQEWSLEVLTERITVRELIRSRVYQEVQDFNRQNSSEFHGLIQPHDSTLTARGFQIGKHRQIDWQEQFARATEAFERGQILLLINDRQAESLDEEIVITPQTEVSFLRLTLLVGG